MTFSNLTIISNRAAGGATDFAGNVATAANYYNGQGAVQTITANVSNVVGAVRMAGTLDDNPDLANWVDLHDSQGNPVVFGHAANAITQDTTFDNISGVAVNSDQNNFFHVASTSDGDGTGARFNVTTDGTTDIYSDCVTIALTAEGTGYQVGDTITISGADLYGTSPANDLTFTLGNTVATAANGVFSTSVIGNFCYVQAFVTGFVSGTINSVNITY